MSKSQVEFVVNVTMFQMFGYFRKREWKLHSVQKVEIFRENNSQQQMRWFHIIFAEKKWE